MPHKNILRMIHRPIKGQYKTGANFDLFCLLYIRRGHNAVERSNFTYDCSYRNRISVVIRYADCKEAKEKN
jgi:hypothetical protein